MGVGVFVLLAVATRPVVGRVASGGPWRLGGWGCLALVVSLALGACTIERGDVRTPSGKPPEADSTLVRQEIEELGAALNRGDRAALDSIFGDSALVYVAGRGRWTRPGDPLTSRLARLPEDEVRFHEIDVRIADGAAWATFRYTSGTAEGVGTMIFQRLRGRWRLVHAHTSERPPDE